MWRFNTLLDCHRTLHTTYFYIEPSQTAVLRQAQVLPRFACQQIRHAGHHDKGHAQAEVSLRHSSNWS